MKKDSFSCFSRKFFLFDLLSGEIRCRRSRVENRRRVSKSFEKDALFSGNCKELNYVKSFFQNGKVER